LSEGKRIVSGRIVAVRIADSKQPRLEIGIAAKRMVNDRGAIPIWCSAPAVSPDGKSLPIGAAHLNAAREYFVGRFAEVEIDQDGTMRAQMLWKRDDES
jgi:hypothetical protein